MHLQAASSQTAPARSRSDRIPEIELLRGFAILGVIAIHAMVGNTAGFSGLRSVTSLMALTVLIDRVAHFAVPLFILLSGAVLAVRYYGDFDRVAFYRRRALSIVPQYLVFSAIYIGRDALSARRLDLSAAILGLFTASSAYHMWFIGLILQLYALYPWIIRAYTALSRAPEPLREIVTPSPFRQYGRIALLLGGAFVAQAFWNVAAIFIEDIAPWPTIGAVLRTVFLGYLLYFILGIYLGRDWGARVETFARLSSKGLALGCCALSLLLGALWLFSLGRYHRFAGIYIYPLYFLVPSLFEPMLYLGVILLLLRLARKMALRSGCLARALASLGRRSFGIYLLHVLVRDTLVEKLQVVGIRSDQWLFYPIVFSSTTLMAFIAVYALGHLPLSEFIIGAARPAEHGRA